MYNFIDNLELAAVKTGNRISGAVSEALLEGETVLSVYRPEKRASDHLVFTTRRIIYAEAGDVVGKKMAVTSLPYRSVRVFHYETSGIQLIGETRLELVTKSGGMLVFDLKGDSEIIPIARAIGEAVL